MRADRLLSLVLLLRARGRMTASALARELEVSTRTVLRDVDALAVSGVPVYAERGRDGGFALLPGWSTDLTGLSQDEARALLVAGSRTGTGPAAPALASAMRKVVAALPDAQRETATRAAGRILLRSDRMLPSGAADSAADARLRTVQQSVFAMRRLRIRYASAGQEARWRVVDPIGLVDAGGQWYLLATHDGADRTYRLSRLHEVELLDEPAAHPPEVDLEELWEQRRTRFRATLTTLAATVRIRPESRTELLHTHVEVTAERVEGDLLVLDVRLGGLEHAVHTIWGLGPDAEVMSPPELRAALAARARATAEHYAER